jgi:galacturan 1,4-alpha-galacturonidase
MLTRSENMVYQGGDDCLALKPNSSMIIAKNVTCYGGTGIAFGSIGQYKGQLDYIKDVYMENINLYPSRQHQQKNGLYFKSWMGYEIGTPPNGGGGGEGYAENIKIKDVYMEDNIRPVYIQTEYVIPDSQAYEELTDKPDLPARQAARG